MRLRIALGASFALLVVAAACGLNPQPLPPGEQADAGSAETPAPSQGGSNGATTGTSSDASAALSDGGGAFAAGEGGTSDGASDAESDSALDGGDAED